MPRVTVVIATYNRSNVLRYAVRSVLRQTFADFELLVVGDGCTDDSEDVVRSFADPRVEWINLPTNSKHQSAPNNEGLRRARGSLIAYLGHDDLWLPHHLEVMVRAFDESNCDLAYSMQMNVAPDGELAWPFIPDAAAGSFASPLCVMHRKIVTDRVGGWRDYRDLTIAPDPELWQRAVAAGFLIAFVPRLTGIKFPGSQRRNVYRERPADEQAKWTERIESQPDFEFRRLADFIVGRSVPSGLPYRQLARLFFRQTVARLRMRFAGAERWPGTKRVLSIDELRRFKGL